MNKEKDFAVGVYQIT